MDNDELEAKRQAAKLAMEGEDYRARREKSEAEVAKQREAARLAMEGNDRKAVREAKEKAEATAAELERRRLAEISRLREMEATRQAEAEAKTSEAKARQQAEAEARVEKIHRAEADINNLKSAAIASISSVRTMHSDLAGAVEKRKISATSIAMKEQELRAQKPIPKPESNFGKNLLIGFLILILLGAGVWAVWYAVNQTNKQNAAVNITNTPKIITAEKVTIVPIATSTPAADIKTEITSKLGQTTTGAQVLYFELPEKTWLTLDQFNKQLLLAIPDAVVRTMQNEFTIGSIAISEQTAPFMIWQIKNPDLALARTFDWEDTMVKDLAALWPELAGTTTQNIVAKDKRVNNLDTRALLDETGQTILTYVFFNNKYVVISTSENALTDLVNRLAP